MNVDNNDQVSSEDQAIVTVLNFVERINTYDTKMYYHSRIKRNAFVKAEYYDLYKDLSEESLANEYYEIYKVTCTDRKRVYGGISTNYGGKPPKYSGISKETIISSSLIKCGRIEVIAKGGQFQDQYYKFVLFKRNGYWLIDSVQSRVGDNEWHQAFL